MIDGHREMVALDGVPSSHKWLKKLQYGQVVIFKECHDLSVPVFLIGLKIVLYWRNVCHFTSSLVLRPMAIAYTPPSS